MSLHLFAITWAVSVTAGCGEEETLSITGDRTRPDAGESEPWVWRPDASRYDEPSGFEAGVCAYEGRRDSDGGLFGAPHVQDAGLPCGCPPADVTDTWISFRADAPRFGCLTHTIGLLCGSFWRTQREHEPWAGRFEDNCSLVATQRFGDGALVWSYGGSSARHLIDGALIEFGGGAPIAIGRAEISTLDSDGTPVPRFFLDVHEIDDESGQIRVSVIDGWGG